MFITVGTYGQFPVLCAIKLFQFIVDGVGSNENLLHISGQ